MRVNAILSIWIITCCGCSVNNELAGKYAAKGAQDYIQLKKDSTFIYEYRSFHLYQTSTGTWKKNGDNAIRLTTEVKSIAMPLKVSPMKTTNEKTNLYFKLNLIGAERLADYKCRIYINDSPSGLIRCDSLSIIPLEKPLKSLYLMFTKEPLVVETTAIPMPLFTEKYIHDSSANINLEVSVNIKDAFFFFRPFDNELIKVNRNSLKIYYSKGRTWEKISKVPDSLNIFSSHNE
jgi:hypothetical protein